MEISELEKTENVKTILRAIDAYQKCINDTAEKKRCETLFNAIVKRMGFKNDDDEWKFIKTIFYNEAQY